MFVCSLRQRLSFQRGFTLAELLISLAILGVIATFTIPKLLSSQQNSQKVAVAKEVASMMSGAYQKYQQDVGTVPTNFNLDSLLPYLNYVSVNTTSQLDDHVGVNLNYDCSDTATYTCLNVHGGGVLYLWKALNFNGNTSTNGLFVLYDPDGSRVGIAGDHPGKAMCFVLFYSGRLSDRAQATFVNNGGSYTLGNFNPSWFSW